MGGCIQNVTDFQADDNHNGLERQHEHLKYSYLSNMSNDSLADIISVLTDTYVPHCHKSLNISCSYKHNDWLLYMFCSPRNVPLKDA